eukprot:TRINITY_DN22176_c0_g1_i2.p1 TRINITY_DN22176_c0_g1~~TRINITY_DN22176_c0_g1_i2.p1  ORF type:complete len:172 (+),score=9.22 TRINITY_DN22176_c0_g1_i2:102-617(+)
MIRRPPRSTLSSSSAASDVYKRQASTPPSNSVENAEVTETVLSPPTRTAILLTPLLPGQRAQNVPTTPIAPIPVPTRHHFHVRVPHRLNRTSAIKSTAPQTPTARSLGLRPATTPMDLTVEFAWAFPGIATSLLGCHRYIRLSATVSGTTCISAYCTTLLALGGHFHRAAS